MTSLTPPDGMNYYGPKAYTPESIPPQPDKTKELHRNWESKLGVWMRLPWGGTEETVPLCALYLATPKMLRKDEHGKKKGFDKNLDLQFDHECLLLEKSAFRTWFLHMMYALGKGFVILLTPVFVLTMLYMFLSFSWMTWEDALTMSMYLIGIPFVIWQLAYWTLELFPNWAVKSSLGPLWELNRRTGLVTVCTYPKKRLFKPRGEPDVFTAPFYEFDPICESLPDRFGVTFVISLYHRYQKYMAGFDRIISRQGNGEDCFAFWDVLQNYMDVSRPLPDIPILEPHRANDPVTAEYDRQVGRPPRYWRDMDKETWKAQEDESIRKTHDIGTLKRPDLMRRSVKFLV